MIITLRVFGGVPVLNEKLLRILQLAVEATLPEGFECEVHDDPMFDEQKLLHTKYGGRVHERGLIIVKEKAK